MRSNTTLEPVDRACTYCGEHNPVQVIDNDGYSPNELICEECFSHELMTWDDLPEARFPREEQKDQEHD